MARAQFDEKTIFNVARNIDSPEARNEYLKQICGDQPALLARVETLLRAYEKQASFLESPAADGVCPTLITTDDGPGMPIGPYKLLQQIGEGGMGTVFMAEQAEPIQRRVALKLIKRGMDSRQIIARFEAERQALAMMDHVNIARVLDAGATAEGHPYFVMELVHGVPITQYCDDNHLTPRERLELFVPVCQAIQHAHQKGIIHRDIKPSNVMITLYDGKPVPKVIDFGVAKAIEKKLTERTMFTQYGTMVGTLEYMSPEQAEMSALGVDTRSDIYSLGVLLYELLAGSTPLTSKQMEHAAYAEIVRMIREEEPPKPSTRLSDSNETQALVSVNRQTEPDKLMRLLRGELDWIVMKCLEKDRNRRYETAGAIAADVLRHLHNEPVQACPPSVGYRVRKLVQRHLSALAAASLVLLALVAGIIGTTWGMLRATDAEAVALAAAGQKEIALRGKEIALAAAQKSKRDADLELFGSYLTQARASRLSGRPGQRFEALDVLKRATGLARSLDLPATRLGELRNAAIASLALPDLYVDESNLSYPLDAAGMDCDAEYKICAITDLQGNCTIRRMADGAELHRLRGLGLGDAGKPHLSRDGKFIAINYSRQVGRARRGVATELWTLDEPTPRPVWAEPEKDARDVAFRDDSQQVALVYNNGAIRLFELPSAQQLVRTLQPESLTREVIIALHPTEPLVAVCSYFDRVVQLRHLRTGEVVASLPQTERISHVTWHPEGQTLVVAGGENGLVHLYDRTTLQRYRTLEVAQAGGLHTRFNHAGDRLVVSGWSGSVELYDIGSGRNLLKTHALRLVNRRFSRDDQRLAGIAQNERIGIWRVGDGRECRTLVRQGLPDKLNSGFLSLALHPDGRLLAAGMTDGFGLWDLRSGSELAFLAMNEEFTGVGAVHFEPNGDLLTASFSGVLRWPIRSDTSATSPLAEGRHLLIGPPQKLLPSAVHVKQSRDGKVIVSGCGAVGPWQTHAGAWILHADRPHDPIRIAAGEDIIQVVPSPDAKWVVTATLSGEAKVWHAVDGKFEKKLGDFGQLYPHFSPDGRWLFTVSSVFDVENWQKSASVGSLTAFAPDSNFMAFQHSTNVTRLVDRATRHEFARLEDPDFELLNSVLFTSDGSQLIGFTSGKVRVIRVWDLRCVREQLATMGLDWDQVALPPARAGQAHVPLHARILSEGFADPRLSREQRLRSAMDRYRDEIEKNPDDPAACNGLAWIYLTAPESMRDIEIALPLAEHATHLAADNADYRNTLGVAYYRAGRFREAVATLQLNLEKQHDKMLAFDLYFLAMSHYRLDDTASAHNYLTWALRWTNSQPDLHPDHRQELDLFRQEATELLQQPDRDTPKDP